VTNGELGAGEAAEVAKLIETYVRAVEATELEQLATFSLRLRRFTEGFDTRDLKEAKALL
jgi:hypothetical protein